MKPQYQKVNLSKSVIDGHFRGCTVFFNAKRKVEMLALKLYSSYVVFGEVKGGPLVWSWLNTTPFKLYIITVNTLPLIKQ